MIIGTLVGLVLVALVAMVAVARWPESAARMTVRLARWLLGLKTHTVMADGVRITYFEGGRGRPLILVHGMGADKDNFLQIAAMLAKHFRVIVPDLPGFGDSDKPADRVYGIEQQVVALRAFTAALGIEQFDLGGNSMGGFVAGAYGAAHPEQVCSLWLLAPAGVKSAEASELIVALAADGPVPILGRTPAELLKVLAFVTHRAPKVPGYMVRALAMQQDRQYEFNRAVIRQLLADSPLDERFAAAPVLIPTLIVWGDKDRALHYSGADILHRLLPHSQVCVLSDVGHVPQIEAPRRIVRDYLAFREALVPTNLVPRGWL